MKEIMAAIDIEASAKSVWEILTDLPSYVLWNPFIHRAYGRVAEGEKLEVHLHIPGAEETTFFPTITHIIPYQEFSWLGRLYLPGLFDGEHHFVLEPHADGSVRFIQRETFSGVLAALILPQLADPTRQGFDAMNAALKARAEAQAAHERAA